LPAGLAGTDPVPTAPIFYRRHRIWLAAPTRVPVVKGMGPLTLKNPSQIMSFQKINVNQTRIVMMDIETGNADKMI
jgi:hypothetical protein